MAFMPNGFPSTDGFASAPVTAMVTSPPRTRAEKPPNVTSTVARSGGLATSRLASACARRSAAPEYGGDAAASNPEELLLAALSTCHMLTFLAVMANRGYVVDHYADDAVAILDKDADGRIAVTRAVLSPQVTFAGDKRPGADEYAKFHERAHAACFIANSVKTKVELKL